MFVKIGQLYKCFDDFSRESITRFNWNMPLHGFRGPLWKDKREKTRRTGDDWDLANAAFRPDFAEWAELNVCLQRLRKQFSKTVTKHNETSDTPQITQLIKNTLYFRSFIEISTWFCTHFERHFWLRLVPRSIKRFANHATGQASKHQTWTSYSYCSRWFYCRPDWLSGFEVLMCSLLEIVVNVLRAVRCL